jgi:hypothetical protein
MLPEEVEFFFSLHLAFSIWNRDLGFADHASPKASQL